MNDRQALLQAVLDDPDDDLVRLVFADWLQENGEEAFAEYIRLQIDRDGLEALDRAGEPLAPEQREKLASVRRGLVDLPVFDRWPGKINRPGWARERYQKRGFTQRVRVRADVWIADGARFTEREPLETLSLDRCPDKSIGEALMLPCNRRLRRLELGDCFRDPDYGIPLMQSPNLGRVSELRLDTSQNGDAIVARLAGSPRLGQLRVIDLRGCRLTPATVEALLGSDRLREPKELAFSVTAPAARVGLWLGRCDALRSLETLRISIEDGENPTDVAIRVPASRGRFRALRDLDLSGLFTAPSLTDLLSRSRDFPSLRRVTLPWSTGVTDLLRLLGTPRPSPLRSVEITRLSDEVVAPGGTIESPLEELICRGDSFREADFGSFIRRVRWLDLRRLRLRGMDLSAGEFADLIASPGLTANLEVLNLRRVRLGDGIVDALIERDWPRLRVLDLAMTGLSRYAISKLEKSRRFPALRHLNLIGNQLEPGDCGRFPDSPMMQNLHEFRIDGWDFTSDDFTDLCREDFFPQIITLGVLAGRTRSADWTKLRERFGRRLVM